MWIKVFRTLFRIAKEVKRIREILEIVHKKELALHFLENRYSSNLPLSEVVVDSDHYIKRDIYGKEIELEESEESEERVNEQS